MDASDWYGLTDSLSFERSAIGEQKRLEKKKAQSQKKSLRRSQDSWDWTVKMYEKDLVNWYDSISEILIVFHNLALAVVPHYNMVNTDHHRLKPVSELIIK